MGFFKKHIPSFCEGFEKVVFEFDTFEELIKRQQPLLKGYKWCYDNYIDHSQLLMVESEDNTKWLVIGYVLDFDLSQYLPKVIYGKETR